MNDCLGKPVTVERLRSVVEKYTLSSKPIEKRIHFENKTDYSSKYIRNNLASESSLKKATTKTSPQPMATEFSHLTPDDKKENLEGENFTELPIFDSEQAKRIAIGNLNILIKIIDKFAQDTPKQLEKLQVALQVENQAETLRLTHSLKGSARSVGALRLGEVACYAETAAKEGNLVQVKSLAEILTEEFAHLQAVWEETEWETLL